MANTSYYVGVDVGTGSVRAGLVDDYGKVVKTEEIPIKIHNPKKSFYEQSSNEIWSACCKAIKVVTSGIQYKAISGIGFDATCSLVVLDENFEPVSVSCDGDDNRNVIMWMDHRAESQAQFINEKGHPVLRYVGGNISLEMQPPKLLWLKQNLPDSCWKRAHHFFDLPDFLTWKATGDLSRSLCSLTCKWSYSSQNGWDEQFWKDIGLEDLTHDDFRKIGSKVLNIGGRVGEGVSEKCHEETGLAMGTAVAVSIIDGHCGGIGTIGCNVKGTDLPCNNLTDRIALICGTSSCHMAISNNPLFVPGVWGPYFSAMIPGFWLNEGGQSAVASLLDHIVQSHCAYGQLCEIAQQSGKHAYACLNKLIEEMTGEESISCCDVLTEDINVWPDFHGNRSPLADPGMKGMMCGLTMDKSLKGLALIYLATIQAVAMGTKHILDTLAEHGHSINTIFMTGGLQKNSIFVQTHASATGLPIVLGKETETVLLGAAVMAACAANNHGLQETMKRMCHIGRIIYPQQTSKLFYEKKYKVFLMMAKHQKEYRDSMKI